MKNPNIENPIREGCYVEYLQTYGDGREVLIRGTVIKSTYRDRGHEFLIQHVNDPKWILTASGARIYNNLRYHEPGERSRVERRRAMKKGRKLKKQRALFRERCVKREWR